MSLDWDALQDQVGAGGCPYSAVLKAIINVLVDKSVVVEADVSAAVDAVVADVIVPG